MSQFKVWWIGVARAGAIKKERIFIIIQQIFKTKKLTGDIFFGMFLVLRKVDSVQGCVQFRFVHKNCSLIILYTYQTEIHRISVF